jgi:prepilin-type N-terminal cleavage/methylation domain-containing protein
MRRVQIASAGVRRSGFTLVEMLAVIGIIVLLVGILLPTIMSARRNAERNAVRMELQTIALALEAYKADFGDYPRPPNDKRKYRVLAWALIGPYGTTAGLATDPLNSSKPIVDGADGPGFRTVWDPATQKGSKVWGPYLAADKFRVATKEVNLDFPTTPLDLWWDILDRYGSPIEYFPRWRNYQAGSNLFGTVVPTPPATPNAVYDFQQQWQKDPTQPPSGVLSPNPQTAVNYLRKALGDDDLNDVINAKETIRETPPFLLLSRGSLRSFSSNAEIQDPSKFPKTEEITNLQH